MKVQVDPDLSTTPVSGGSRLRYAAGVYASPTKCSTPLVRAFVGRELSLYRSPTKSSSEPVAPSDSGWNDNRSTRRAQPASSPDGRQYDSIVGLSPAYSASGPQSCRLGGTKTAIQFSPDCPSVPNPKSRMSIALPV